MSSDGLWTEGEHIGVQQNSENAISTSVVKEMKKKKSREDAKYI